ncbi:MAG: GTPase [Gammaproteobacteria bacterium]|nr:GTPase [Gammaproteobacteria bacterium]
MSVLLFVYNADSGKLNALLDSAHKIVSPSTYNCQLCQLTYGLMNEKQAWKDFREQLDEEVLFLHRDEFEKQYEQKLQYPFLARVENKLIEVLLSAEELSEVEDTQALIERVRQVIG